jgi:nicotinamidase-related amidase
MKPDYGRAAVLTIDVQNDFVLPGAPAEVPGTRELLGNMRRVLEAARKAKIPVIHVVRLYRRDGSNVDLFRREAVRRGEGVVLAGGPGAEIASELLPAASPEICRLDEKILLAGEFQAFAPREWAMYKPRFGAFYQTGLEAFLRERGVDTLIFLGCNFPNCPRTSIYEACERDFKLVVVRDGLSGLYERGEQELKNIGVTLVTAGEGA